MREIKTLLLVLALLVAWSDGEKILFQASNSGSRQLKVKHSKVNKNRRTKQQMGITNKDVGLSLLTTLKQVAKRLSLAMATRKVFVPSIPMMIKFGE